MCQRSPYPRCSNHARIELDKALQSGDQHRILEAQDAYNCSPAGIKALEESNDPRVEAYKALRQRKIDAAQEAWCAEEEAQRKLSQKKEIEEKRDYADAENRIVKLFSPGAQFEYKGRTFISVESAKPVNDKGGEGKTDIYIRAVDADDNEEEIKISYKKTNADSYENWVTPSRAEATFGENWKDIVSTAVERNRENFEKANKYARRIRSTKSKHKGGSYVVGYAFDIRKNPRNLSARLDMLTTEQEKEIYSGATLPDIKKHSRINGRTVQNSGVATHMLVADNLKTPQEAIDSCVSMDDYVKEHKGQLHIAFKAVNYYYYEDKGENSRTLAVTVDWKKNNRGRMTNKVNFDSLMETNSTMAIRNLKNTFGR